MAGTTRQQTLKRNFYRRYTFAPKRALRGAIARSWWLTKLWYRPHGLSIRGRPTDDVWYFAFGANMHDSACRERRQMRPIEWRPGRIRGYRLRFNLEGRPKGKAAPAKISLDPKAEVCGLLYQITRKDLQWLDHTEGVPGHRYRHLWLDAEDIEARTHNAPEHRVRFLKSVKHAE